MRIAISGNTYQHEMLEHIERLLLALAARGVQLVAERAFDSYLRQQLPGLPPMRQCELENGVDAQAIMSIGGDGTFLRTAQAVCSQDIPIMGVNSGHLGYLTTADVKDTALIVEALTGGTYRIEHRSMLELGCDSAQVLPPLPYALNEISIVRQETSSMIDVTVDIDGQCTVLKSGTSVRIARAPHTTGVIQLQGTNFAHTLRHKLMWGKDNR